MHCLIIVAFEHFREGLDPAYRALCTAVQRRLFARADERESSTRIRPAAGTKTRAARPSAARSRPRPCGERRSRVVRGGKHADLRGASLCAAPRIHEQQRGDADSAPPHHHRDGIGEVCLRAREHHLCASQRRDSAHKWCGDTANKVRSADKGGAVGSRRAS